MQENIKKLVALGIFSSSGETIQDPNGIEHVNRREHLISNIELPISDEDAIALCSILGTEEYDDYFGLIQKLLQIIETAPS